MSANPTELERELIALLGPENLVGGPRQWHTVPRSASQIAELTSVARRCNATLVPLGRGGRTTSLTDSRPQILLDMRRLDHVLHLDEISLLVHVQAGITGVALEQILSKRGLTIGDFPPAALSSSIGGLLSVRTPGKSAGRRGTFEDMVLGVSAVLADGRSIHTRVAPRRATGPDLARALCGSEGTLAIITSAVLRIHKKPETRLLAAYRLPSFDEALKAVLMALREEAAPAALRAYDSAEAHAHLGPDICGKSEAVLVAATVGPTSLATCDRDLIGSAVEVSGGQVLESSVAATWWNRRIGKETQQSPPVAPNLQVTATLGKLSRVYEAICGAAAEADLQARAHGSRFARDGGVLFFTIGDSHGPLAAEEQALESIAEVAESAGAYLLGKTNPELHSYYSALRDALDPNRHLNPDVLS